MIRQLSSALIALILIHGSVVYVYADGHLCPDVYVLFARGSGQEQHNRDSQLQTYKFFDEIKNRSSDPAGVRSDELIYPAVGRIHYGNAEWSWTPGEYRDSVETGTNNAVELLNTKVANCPNQKIVLGGYSQGAHVMGDVLYQLSDEVADQIVYVALFGDPKFLPKSFAARGDFERQSGGILEPRLEDFPDKFKGKVYSWCKKLDGICTNNFYQQYSGNSTHSAYQNIEIPVAVNEAAILLSQYYPGFGALPVGIENPLPSLDVVLAFENSTATARSVRYIKGQAAKVIDYIMNLSEDARIGLIDFTHQINQTEIAREVLELTGDKYQAIDGLQNIRTDAQYDTQDQTQPLFSGVMKAVSEQNWRDNALKVVLYLTRFPPQDPEPGSAYTTPQVTASARQSGPIALYPLYNHDAPVEWLAIHKSIADATGGRLTFYPDGEYANAPAYLEDALFKLKLSPAPIVLGPYAWRTHVPMLLSVGGVYDADGRVATYQWDFDNDQSYDQETSHPVVSHVFENNYVGPVWVKITIDDGQEDGQTSYIKMLVDVDEAHVLIRRPSEPQGARSWPGIIGTQSSRQSADGSSRVYTIDIYWSEPGDDGGTPIEAYAIYGNGELIGFAAGDQYQVSIEDAPVDAKYEVAAVNSSGFGPRRQVEIKPID